MMKTTILISLVLVSFFTNTNGQQTTMADTEKKAIIQTLEEESAGVIDVDYERWADTWIHDERASFIWVNNNYYSLKSGWNEVGSWIKNTLHNISDTEKLYKENYQIHVNGNMAWAIYNEKSYKQNNEFSGQLLVTKILEKKNNQWKIVHTSVVNETSYQKENTEEQ